MRMESSTSRIDPTTGCARLISPETPQPWPEPNRPAPRVTTDRPPTPNSMTRWRWRLIALGTSTSLIWATTGYGWFGSGPAERDGRYARSPPNGPACRDGAPGGRLPDRGAADESARHRPDLANRDPLRHQHR